MRESAPLPSPLLTALAHQNPSPTPPPPRACSPLRGQLPAFIASSTSKILSYKPAYVEEREALKKSRSGLCKSPSLHVLLGIKKLILKKEAQKTIVSKKRKVKNI